MAHELVHSVRLSRVLAQSAAAVGFTCAALAQSIERASVDLSGGDANGPSSKPSLSGDARYIAFESNATDLVVNDANGASSDIFIRDRFTRTTQLVSVSSSGQQVGWGSKSPSLSRDARFVAFLGVGLDPAHTDGLPKVYVRDLALGTTSWATPVNDDSLYGAPELSADGRVLTYQREVYPSSDYCTELCVRDLATGVVHGVYGCMNVYGYGSTHLYPHLSGDGRWVDYLRRYGLPNYGSEVVRLDAATGSASGLGFESYVLDVSYYGRFTLYETSYPTSSYLRDNMTGASTFLANGFNQGSGAPGMFAAISDDDRFVAYASYTDVFELELATGASTTIVQTGAPVFDVAISGDGNCIAFASWANGIVAGDANGHKDVFVRAECGVGGAYCTSSTTTNGCTPSIGASGTASASATSGYVVSVQQVEGQRPGILLYALTAAAIPWAATSSSHLCLAAPRQRTTAQWSGGTLASCDGVLALDLLAWISNHPGAVGVPLYAGQSLYLQGWFRDPPAPKGSNLSDGWFIQLCP